MSDAERQARVLHVLRDHPGVDGPGLVIGGLLDRTDAEVLRTLEHKGLIEHRARGWHLTARGDLTLMRQTPGPKETE